MYGKKRTDGAIGEFRIREEGKVKVRSMRENMSSIAVNLVRENPYYAFFMIFCEKSHHIK